MALGDHNANLLVKCLMNEGGTGDAVNDGTGGNLTAFNSPGDLAGVVDRGRQCMEASSQHFDRNNADVRCGNNDFSVAFWFKPTTGNDNYYRTAVALYDHGADADKTFNVTRNFDETWSFVVWYDAVGGLVELISTEAPADTNWHCIVCVYNQASTSLTIYVDDVKKSTTNASLSSLNVGSSGVFSVGERYNLNRKFDGSFDIVCFWDNVALTDAEASEFYNSGSGVEVFAGGGGGGDPVNEANLVNASNLDLAPGLINKANLVNTL